jgi:hypothetical protein
MTSLNLEYVPEWEASPNQHFSYYAGPGAEAMYIGGYTHTLRFSIGSVRDSLRITDGTFFRLTSDSTSLQVVRRGAVLFDIPLQPLVDKAIAQDRRGVNRSMSPAALCVETRRGSAAALVCLRQLTGVKRQGAARLTRFDGELFVRLP